MDYLDQDTGKVLFAEPDKTYNIQATGFNAPDIPPSNFILDEEKEDEKEEPFPAPEVEE
jgi:hypothetical protein